MSEGEGYSFRPRRRIPNFETLDREVQCWTNQRTTSGASVEWHFTTEDARIKLKHLYPKIEN